MNDNYLAYQAQKGMQMRLSSLEALEARYPITAFCLAVPVTHTHTRAHTYTHARTQNLDALPC